MRLTAAIAAMIAAAAISFAAPAAADPMPAPDRAAIAAAPASMPPALRVADIPPSVRAIAFPYMVDPGRPFQVTDVIMPGQDLPGGRLVWGVRIGRLYVLHSEFGGIAHGFQVRVYDLGATSAREVWKAYGPRYPSFAAFQAALRSSRVEATH